MRRNPRRVAEAILAVVPAAASTDLRRLVASMPEDPLRTLDHFDDLARSVMGAIGASLDAPWKVSALALLTNQSIREVKEQFGLRAAA